MFNSGMGLVQGPPIMLGLGWESHAICLLVRFDRCYYQSSFSGRGFPSTSTKMSSEPKLEEQQPGVCFDEGHFGGQKDKGMYVHQTCWVNVLAPHQSPDSVAFLDTNDCCLLVFLEAKERQQRCLFALLARWRNPMLHMFLTSPHR